MTVLYLDTTSSFLYAGIVKDNVLLIEEKKELGKDLSIYTLDTIKNMLEKTNLTPNNIDKIIVVNGPGSFTGIRIGVTIAKTFAWGLKKDITTISSLDAMAVSIKENKCKIPVIDARRDCSYFGIYDESNNIVLENKYASNDYINEQIKKLNKDYIIISNETTLKNNNIVSYNPNILEIVKKYINKENINPHAVNPIYLKLTEAEEKQNAGN